MTLTQPSTGSDVLCRTLERLGVERVFGVPGTQNIGLYESFRRSCIRPILTTHELAASFMANGYTRAAGSVGVLVTIPGPGFAFAMAGLAEARHDSAALLHIVSQPATSPGVQFQLQAIDQTAIVGPVVKQIVSVDDPGAIAAQTEEAYRAALADEPGPVLLHCSPDMLAAQVEGSPPLTVSFHERKEVDRANLQHVRGLIARARRPGSQRPRRGRG